jgi:threonine aldolase
MKRRQFLASPLAAGLAYDLQAATAGKPVIAGGDGLSLSPVEYTALLQKLSPGIKEDSYALGGAVAQLEEKVAASLGKEVAVWLPTGTLANHLAVRILAGDRRRVLVQQECHLFNDCGDCCQTLSGLHLIGLAPGQATFTLEQVKTEADRAASGRVTVPIGAIQIETPVRRKTGEMFDLSEMRRIAAWAREQRIGLHLDGARLYLAAAYSGVPVQEYARLFDTVYVSMYKYFNAPAGAVLAGPRTLLENLFHTRRMFGGGLSQAWPFAAVASHYFEGFEERYRQAVGVSEKVIAGLEGDGRYEVQRIPAGTNLFTLRMKQGDPVRLRERLIKEGFEMPRPQDGRVLLSVNETWNRATAEEILAKFRQVAN